MSLSDVVVIVGDRSHIRSAQPSKLNDTFLHCENSENSKLYPKNKRFAVLQLGICVLCKNILKNIFYAKKNLMNSKEKEESQQNI